MEIALYAIAGAAVLVVLLALGLSAMMRRLTATGQAMIGERFAPDQIELADPIANFFGLESLGALQLRGNGPLVLTREALWFHALMGDRELTVPRSSVLEVKVVRSHLGKTVGRGLLHLRFQGPTGEDGVAFFVRDLAAWQAALARK